MVPCENNGLFHERCSICSQLKQQESATQKYGWGENDTHLPGASNKLELVRDFKPNDARALQLLQCPLCGTYYLYKTDYEYLANGSEDEQELICLTTEQANEYLERNVPG